MMVIHCHEDNGKNYEEEEENDDRKGRGKERKIKTIKKMEGGGD